MKSQGGLSRKRSLDLVAGPLDIFLMGDKGRTAGNLNCPVPTKQEPVAVCIHYMSKWKQLTYQQREFLRGFLKRLGDWTCMGFCFCYVEK